MSRSRRGGGGHPHGRDRAGNGGRARSGRQHVGLRRAIAAKGNPPSYTRGRTYGYALIGYQRAGTIKGTVTGAAAGDVVALLAEPFGTHSFTATGKTTSLAASGSSSYSFSAQPSLVTRYEVRVSTSGVADATSKTATIYVMPRGYGSRSSKVCHRKICTVSYSTYIFLPASAYHT